MIRPRQESRARGIAREGLDLLAGGRPSAERDPVLRARWPPPPPGGQPRLGDEIHIWRVSLEPEPDVLGGLWDTLTEEERSRAARFVFPTDCRHFVFARGAVRRILGQYLACGPQGVRFRYSPHGKPDLDEDSCGGEALRFSLSHSGSLALLAVARGRDLGVDIERIRPGVETEQIAERFFSVVEVAALRAVPVASRREAFFSCWTRKEAYIKGSGEGLSMPLDCFDVSLTPGEPARLLATRGEAKERGVWSLRELDPGPGYVAALAAEGRNWGMSLREWPWEGVRA